MTPEQIASAFRSQDPDQLKKTFELLRNVFAARAENAFDQDPQNNGELAQAYADIAQLVEAASMVWDEEEETPIDKVEASSTVEERRPRLSDRVSARKNPWGGR